MTVQQNSTFKKSLINQDILTGCFADVKYAFIFLITFYYNISAYMTFEERPVKIYWIIKGVLEKSFCCEVIK